MCLLCKQFVDINAFKTGGGFLPTFFTTPSTQLLIFLCQGLEVRLKMLYGENRPLVLGQMRFLKLNVDGVPSCFRH